MATSNQSDEPICRVVPRKGCGSTFYIHDVPAEMSSAEILLVDGLPKVGSDFETTVGGAKTKKHCKSIQLTRCNDTTFKAVATWGAIENDDSEE